MTYFEVCKYLDRLELLPAVALLGPRQVGKTALAEDIASGRPSVYLDLESPRDRSKLADPARYLVPVHKDCLFSRKDAKTQRTPRQKSKFY